VSGGATGSNDNMSTQGYGLAIDPLALMEHADKIQVRPAPLTPDQRLSEGLSHDPHADNPAGRPETDAAKSNSELGNDPNHPLGRKACPKCDSVNVQSPGYPGDF